MTRFTLSFNVPVLAKLGQIYPIKCPLTYHENNPLDFICNGRIFSASVFPLKLCLPDVSLKPLIFLNLFWDENDSDATLLVMNSREISCKFFYQSKKNQ